jgi:copper oxidase (laccase) domain-containing protein
VVTKLRVEMDEAGHTPIRAALGPGIGACCFEVGEEVAMKFERFTGSTTWDTTGVDLAASIRSELYGLEIWSADSCTRHEPGWFSHRRDETTARLATIGWLP